MKLEPATSRQAAIAHLTAAFAAAGLATPALDARLLVCAAAGIGHLALVRDPGLPLGECAARAQTYGARRLAREPVSRIIGKREFWGLPLSVTPDVLDPRADTETLVEAVLSALPDRARHLRILDLGTGSGALLCALLHEYSNATGTGVDVSPAACAIARANLASLGLAARGSIVNDGWGAALPQRFDLVVSNPPYIESACIPALAFEVRDHDPLLALDGGSDGLDCYREIVLLLPALMLAGGLAVLEAGSGQGPAIAALATAQRLDFIELRKDLGGIGRAVVLRRAGAAAVAQNGLSTWM